LVDLSRGRFGTHQGELDLTKVIGQPEGFSLPLGRDRAFFFRPILAEKLTRLRRKTQLIYPKDLAAMMMASGLGKEDRIIEAGTGSGALLIALLTVVTKGRIVTLDQSQELQLLARENVRRCFGQVPGRVRFIQADVYQETSLRLKPNWADRIFLDLPEPWQALHLLKYLRPGGFLTVFNPQIFQLQKVAVALKNHFIDLSVSEVLKRDWLVDEQRLRPADVMRAHTGFFLTARKVS
ncbi:MAG TPA: methyltransferase domain-containing protein, partial [bacterium]|nr:methyltransferase domain-containing protein [bacterium]